MIRLAALALAFVSLVACQNETHAVFSPGPSPTPHLPTTSAILQPGEVPSGLIACPGSGPIEVYLAVLATGDAIVGARANDQWVQLLKNGAREGAIAVYAAGGSACSADVGAVGGVKAITTFVARFSDPTAAAVAWQAGVFGFIPPAPGQLTSGVTLGASTGLGGDSFTYERPSVRLATWRHGIYVAMLVVSNLDVNAFQAAAAAVDARLN